MHDQEEGRAEGEEERRKDDKPEAVDAPKSVIPVRTKLAVVSDGGTVLLFNFSTFSTPKVQQPTLTEKEKK